ncbi:KRRI-Interacting protein 1 [Arthrobotrys musiformis]|uniref:KRRI-Interacting protein 1 n=1 Tax=Arthrobotrys musiformis TaxID=47236 RepID=A0AAV9VZL8_9PEZI
MARKKSATAKAREANGDAHPKDTTIHSKTVLSFDSDSEADTTSAKPNGSKKRKATDDGSDAEDSESGFKINAEYAKRFEHNKKREELHRLEEKYGKSSSSKRRKTDGDDDEDSLASSDESSSSEDEDEIGELVTNDIDAQIKATINAIRSKDPRVYDLKAKFFDDEDAEGGDDKAPKEKSMTLKQYHQKNIMEGYTGGEDEDAPPMTYVEEQEHLKRTVVGEMHAAAEGSDEEEEADFLIRKPNEQGAEEEETPDVALPENPEADPEKFLDAFFTTKAWMPKDAAGNLPFESDDEEEEDAAEEFEQMYNMRFEDPTIADRSKIITHARDIAKQKSLRREEKSRRKKARDDKRSRKEREEEEKNAEKSRLRKLRVEEMEKKIKMVREAGGLEVEAEAEAVGDKWKKFLDDAWEDEGWDKQMGDLYGDKYYDEKEGLGNDDDDDEEDEDKGKGKKSKKPKKPTWDDDIDINDLVPDFKADESMSDAGDAEEGGVALEKPIAASSSSAAEKPKKGAKKDKRADRLLRAQIESYVDDKMPLSLPGSSKNGGSVFRYREVTPESFQLTPTDILFAGDKQLNTYAGLKKLAAYRDDAKKLKDRKRYAKNKGFKLREWRKEVFGKAEISWEELNGGGKGDKSAKKSKKEKGDKPKADGGEEGAASADKKKKRRRKNKGTKEATEAEA